MKIIIHAGAGKTGSTSIQNALNRFNTLLKENGIFYAGYMFENLEPHNFIWQSKRGLQYLHSMQEDEFVKQLCSVFDRAISSARENQYNTIIWSNEALFDRPFLLKKVINNLSAYHDYTIVAYVRRHDKWLESAYKQFSIYGKTYEGKVQTFKEWSQNHKMGFSKTLNNLNDIEGINLSVRNLDGVKNVVTDFFNLLDLTVNYTQSDNTAIPSEKMVFRALFANEYSGKVGGNDYNDFMGRIISCEETAQSFLDRLLPDSDDLIYASQSLKDDIETTNAYLKDNNQQQISISNISIKANSIDESKLLFALMEIVFIQGKKISSLEKRVSKLQNENE